MKLFSKIPFPYGYTILLDFLNSRDDNKYRLKEYAIKALSFFKSDKIREYALEKLKTTNRPDYYTSLLIENYQKSDDIVLEKIIKSTYSDDRIHNLIFDYLSIYEKNPTTKCKNIFEYFYTKMNCGIHRYDVVILLYNNKVLSSEMQKELAYDSDNDTRTFFDDVVKINNK